MLTASAPGVGPLGSPLQPSDTRVRIDASRTRAAGLIGSFLYESGIGVRALRSAPAKLASIHIREPTGLAEPGRMHPQTKDLYPQSIGSRPHNLRQPGSTATGSAIPAPG